MARILVLGHSYLHKSSASGSIERAFFEYLQKNGNDVTVICSDHNDMPEKELNCTVIQTKDNQLIRLFVAFLKRAVAPDFAFMPDYTQFSWCPNVYKDACKLIENRGFDYIHSIGIPHSTHLTAYKLKQKYNIPWIAQFYDPWAGNPYRNYKFRKYKEKDALNEAIVAKYADYIIHDSYAVARDWENRYGDVVRSKIVELPFVIDKRVLPKLYEKTANRVLTISHIGNFFPSRTSEVFISAVEKLINLYPEYKEKLKINYIGAVTDAEKTKIKEFNLDSVFDLKGTISAEECIEYYQKSDIFLSIDRRDGDSYFFPSKIMKYFYFQKPILGITPLGSVLDYELTQSGNYSFRHEDIDGIVAFLVKAIDDYNTILKNIKLDYWEKFQVDNVAAKYISLLKFRK